MKKRILFVFEGVLGYGGIQSVIMSIVRALHKDCIFDILLLKSGDSAYEQEFRSYGGEVYTVIPFYEGGSRVMQRLDYYIRSPRLYRKISSFIKGKGYAAIHCNLSGENGVVMKAAKKAGIPVRIVHSHTVMKTDHFNSLRKLIDKRQKRLITKYATCRIVCSQKAGGRFENGEYDRVIYNSYNDEVFNLDLYKNKETYSGIKLLQIGRFSKDKNQEFSLAILAEILKTKPDTTLTLVGGVGDCEEKRIAALAEQMGIADKINFIPATDKIAPILNEHNVFLFPSQKEGFGIALIEAQAMGIKCFASDAVPSETDCGGVEFLPLSAGARHWAEKIIADYEETGGAHKKYDCSAFSSQNIAEQYKKLYSGE